MRLNMKNKVLTFIIGVLVGAIITTLGFLIYNKVVVKNNFNQPEMMQMNGNEQMQQAQMAYLAMEVVQQQIIHLLMEQL